MKKFILMTAGAFIMLNLYAQEFMGIKVDGTRQQVTAKFAEKGFTAKREANGALIISGTSNGTKMEVYCFFTPKTGKCWKFAVYLPEQTSWYALKSDFEKYVGILSDKYGKPEKNYSFFMNPYKEGDGYEMTAVAVDKCRYLAFWTEMYTVEITKFKQVKVSYENPENSKLDDEEKKAINSNTF